MRHAEAYADKTQIYGCCGPSEVNTLQERIAICLTESLWMMAEQVAAQPTHDINRMVFIGLA